MERQLALPDWTCRALRSELRRRKQRDAARGGRVKAEYVVALRALWDEEDRAALEARIAAPSAAISAPAEHVETLDGVPESAEPTVPMPDLQPPPAPLERLSTVLLYSVADWLGGICRDVASMARVSRSLRALLTMALVVAPVSRVRAQPRSANNKRRKVVVVSATAAPTIQSAFLARCSTAILEAADEPSIWRLGLRCPRLERIVLRRTDLSNRAVTALLTGCRTTVRRLEITDGSYDWTDLRALGTASAPLLTSVRFDRVDVTSTRRWYAPYDCDGDWRLPDAVESVDWTGAMESLPLLTLQWALRSRLRHLTLTLTDTRYGNAIIPTKMVKTLVTTVTTEVTVLETVMVRFPSPLAIDKETAAILRWHLHLLPPTVRVRRLLLGANHDG